MAGGGVEISLQQGLAFGLVAATIVAFVMGRWRYDLIAVVALVAGLAIGVFRPRRRSTASATTSP